jgi:hypothetical protein
MQGSIKAFGPMCLEEQVRKPILQQLDLSELPEKGPYFVDFNEFMKKEYPQQDFEGNPAGGNIGPNGKDDGGKNFIEDHTDDFLEAEKTATEEEKAADDIAIRWPRK